MVNLADVKRLENGQVPFLPFATPDRAERHKLDFSTIPTFIQDQIKPKMSEEIRPTPPDAVTKMQFSWMKQDSDGEKREDNDSSFNIDDLVAKIDKKIAELEAEERAEKEKQKATEELMSVVTGIESRRSELMKNQDRNESVPSDTGKNEV